MVSPPLLFALAYHITSSSSVSQSAEEEEKEETNANIWPAHPREIPICQSELERESRVFGWDEGYHGVTVKKSHLNAKFGHISRVRIA